LSERREILKSDCQTAHRRTDLNRSAEESLDEQGVEQEKKRKKKSTILWAADIGGNSEGIGIILANRHSFPAVLLGDVVRDNLSRELADIIV